MRTISCTKKTGTQNNDSNNRKKILYIPGFLSGKDPQNEAKEELRRQFPSCKVSSIAWDKSNWLDIFSGVQNPAKMFCSALSAWNSFASSSKALFENAFFLNPVNNLGLPIRPSENVLVQWRNACQNALKVAKELAKLIEKMSNAERQNLILVGHSLGANIVVHTLKALSDRQLKINQAYLLGAAVNSDDAAIPAACRATINPIESTINEMDWALTLYKIVTLSSALGQRGYTGKKNVALKERYLCPTFTHSNVFYIKQMGNNRTTAPGSPLPFPFPLPFPKPGFPFIQ